MRPASRRLSQSLNQNNPRTHGCGERTEKGEKSVSVNAGQRNVPETPANIQLDACWLARGVALHTIKICTNKNIFLPEYQTALTDDLIRTAKNIYIYVWTANNINVSKRASHWKYREQYQFKAVLECNNLLAMIGLARSLYHLRGKKAAYWSKQVIEARKKIQAWHAKDVERYANLAPEQQKGKGSK